MDGTRIAEQGQGAGVPLTDAEKEQARYALWEMARSTSDPDALKVTPEQLAVVQPFFELGWAMGVRTGHTGPAMADVPVDLLTIDRAFIELLLSERLANQLALSVARALDPQGGGPGLWQKVRYHGSLTQCHGLYWVQAIKAQADRFGAPPTVRYDLCKVVDRIPVRTVRDARPQSLTPLSEFRAPLD
ncbi:hypothetical protein PEM37_38675 [Streptomyces sp. AD681]|uniref:hypothetical protein n=1 Tax=Streptomyces TaxID=1883 RepID=UPI0022F1798E|nr:hypothetical protein [Streptomyces sp. AD681]MDA5147435.1 hypothetical protein [Streptomyces sp. AD681]